MGTFDENELERIKRIRESDITKDYHKFDEAFREAMKQRKKEPIYEEWPPWAIYLKATPIETREHLAEFRKRFPDAKGEVIMMQLMKLAGMMGL